MYRATLFFEVRYPDFRLRTQRLSAGGGGKCFWMCMSTMLTSGIVDRCKSNTTREGHWDVRVQERSGSIWTMLGSTVEFAGSADGYDLDRSTER